jgi:hypothetical protein
MSATIQLDAGGLLPITDAVDEGATEQIVARSYRHPALGERSVIRLASDRLGQAEDLAMEFLGFEAPAVSAPLAIQQRRSLGFAAWALINDPANARFALDLVKRMKAAARQARSKPGHAWDSYMDMAKELGRSARLFLPPFWEEVGRAFKDLGNQTYAGRALNKSLEAERVHALESDRARRRDVVLEFVLSGCLAGSALSDYGNDLLNHHAPKEAFAIFRDLCVRRTRGGMSPWATLPKDFTKLAKAAELDGDAELEKWLEEVIEAPAMGRSPQQFWKTTSAHCKRIVARNPAFAVALLRHTRPEPRYYGESKLGPWFDLLDEWGVFEYLWEDEHNGAPSLGEPIANWFGRILCDETPVPKRSLLMLEKLAPRLKKENVPLPLSVGKRYGANAVDIDVLEACFVAGIKVADPPSEFTVTFSGWLSADVDHPFRNQDIVEAPKDGRFQSAIFHGLDEALTCRGGAMQRGYRQANLEQRAFPLAAGDRPGIKELWHQHTSRLLDTLEKSGLASFETALERLTSTLWPDTLRLFSDLAERLQRIDTVAMLQRTLQAGVFDEYGLPALEKFIEDSNITIQHDHYGDTNLHLTFPNIVLSDKVHAYVIGSDGQVKKHELRLPKKSTILTLVPVGDDLAVTYRDDKYQGHFYWVSDPSQQYDANPYGFYRGGDQRMATMLEDGSTFLGHQSVRPGDKQLSETRPYIQDGQRFWHVDNAYDAETEGYKWQIKEVDPHTGKLGRTSVPPWFEETEGGTIELSASELRRAPAGAEGSPLGVKDGMLGWKTMKRSDGSYLGIGIDGRHWDKPLLQENGLSALPVALLRQPGTQAYLPVTAFGGRTGSYRIWDASGSTAVAVLQDFEPNYAAGQVTVLPLHFWHLLKVRDEASSQKLRAIGHDQCTALFQAAAEDREREKSTRRSSKKESSENPLTTLVPAVKQLLPTAPERLAVGVARLIEQAERSSASFLALRDKAATDSTKETTSAAAAEHRKCDLAAAHWGMEALASDDEEGPASISEHLTAAAAFLKGTSTAGELPQTNYLWFPILDNFPLQCWLTFWRVLEKKSTKKGNREVPWLEFLKLWHDLGIAELPGQFDILEGHPEGAKKNRWGGYDVEVTDGKSFTLQKDEDRFVVVEHESYNSTPYHFLRYSTAQKPGVPPGYTVKNVRKVKEKYDRAKIEAFIAAAESCTEPPLPTREELEEVARNVSASPAEIGLIWIGGLNLDNYQNNFLPTELRTALGLKITDANAGRQALRNLKDSVRNDLYEAVVSQGLAAPFAADRTPVLRAIEKAWQDKMPKRLHLEAGLQTRLSALGRTSRWEQLDHEVLLAVAADPAEHPLLQPREIEIKVDKKQSYGGLQLGAKNKNEEAIDGRSLRSIVQLVALVHAGTPAGHPARAEMPGLIKQTTKLLEHSSTLLELCTTYVFEDGRNKRLKPAEWLNKHVGKSKANTKDGTVRFDDGLLTAAALDSQHEVLVAFRPAKLKDEADLVRLRGILAVEVGEDDDVNGGILPIVVAIKSSGFQKLAKAILAKDVPEGQWPQNPKHTAPAIVQAIQKKCKLGEDAAMLYAQLLAVPDPTTANVCAWNGWRAPQFKKAAVELVERKLVLSAERARAGRSIFLPGEWLELKAPWLPIESWKLAHLVEQDMDPRELCPAGGPMVLRPFEDLFAAAWKRVVDGDAPRYEEVKRSKKKK